MFLRFPCEILRKNTSKCYALAYFYLYYNSSKNICLQGYFCAESQESVRILLKIRVGLLVPKCSVNTSTLVLYYFAFA